MSWCQLPKDIKCYIYKMIIQEYLVYHKYNANEWFRCHPLLTKINNNAPKKITPDIYLIVALLNRLSFNRECKSALRSLCKFGINDGGGVSYWTFCY